MDHGVWIREFKRTAGDDFLAVYMYDVVLYDMYDMIV